MPNLLDAVNKAVQKTVSTATEATWRILGWPSEQAWINAGRPSTPYQAPTTFGSLMAGDLSRVGGLQTAGGISSGAQAAPLSPSAPMSVTAPQPLSPTPMAPAAPITPSPVAPMAPAAATAGATAGLVPEAQQIQPKPDGGFLGGLVNAATGAVNAVGDVAGTVGSLPLSAVPGLGGLGAALAVGGKDPTIGGAAQFAVDERGNPVSRFIADEVRPRVADVGEVAGDIFGNTGAGAGLNMGLAAIGAAGGPKIDTGDVGRAVGQYGTPVSPLDLALSLVVPATADWADAYRVLKGTGLIDDAGRVLSGVSRGQVDNVLRQVGKTYDDIVQAVGKNIGPFGMVDGGIDDLGGQVSKAADEGAGARRPSVFSASQFDEALPGEALEGFRGTNIDGVGFGASEGKGLYVADDESLARFFAGDDGAVTPTRFSKPKNPLVVNEPLYLLEEADELSEPIKKSDSLWLTLNKMAYHLDQLDQTAKGAKAGTWDQDNVAEHLTALIKGRGYDAVRVPHGEGNSWTVLLDESLTRNIGAAPLDAARAIDTPPIEASRALPAADEVPAGRATPLRGADEGLSGAATSSAPLNNATREAASRDFLSSVKAMPEPAPAPLPRGALPGASLEEQMAASLKLGREGVQTAQSAANPRVSVFDMKKALDDAGLDSSGTASQVAARYRGMQSQAIGGIGTPRENVQNAARKAYGEALERSGDPEAARLAARRAAAQEGGANYRASRMNALLNAFKDERGTMSIKNLPAWGKLSDELTALIGLPRTLKASFDLSAPGRQGLALGFRHPKEWLESWKPMLQAWKSDDGMKIVNDKIDAMMGYWRNKYGDDVIHAYQTGAGAEGLERVPGFEAAGEGIISGVTRNIPGMAQSERSYATFLNYQKAKTFDTMARSLERAGVTDEASFKRLGSIIDHATGYGAAPLKGRFEGQAFFSQRYLTSRIQYLVDPITEGLAKGDLRAAQAATENLVAFMGGMAGLAYLINASGVAEVELDPRSSDFGKIRIGPQRFDFGAGFLPLLRTAARTATGQAKSAGGSVYDVDEKLEVLKFFRNKLAPIPSEIVTRIVGEDPIGEKPSDPLSLDFARQMFMPLIADAVLEAFEETGDPTRAALAAGSELFGGGASAYGSGQSVQKAIAEERFGSEWDDLNSQQQAEINAEIAESGVELEWRERSNVWWQAREDAFEYWKSDLDEESRAHPIVQHVLEQDSLAGVFPGPDSEGELAKWIQDTYQVSRQEAVDYANGVQRQTGLDDLVQRFRSQVATIDTGYVDAWVEAYENGDTDDGPPKWVREMIEEPVSVP